MNEIVQALATLETDPAQADALGKVAAQAKQAAQSSTEAQASAKTALLEALKRCRERGDAELWIALCDATLDSGLVTAASERADLLTEKAKVFSDDLLRDADATTALNAALALVDDHEAAQDALEQLRRSRATGKRSCKKWLDEAKRSTERQLTTGLSRASASTTASTAVRRAMPKLLVQGAVR
jgi:hypothetical protein